MERAGSIDLPNHLPRNIPGATHDGQTAGYRNGSRPQGRRENPDHSPHPDTSGMDRIGRIGIIRPVRRSLTEPALSTSAITIRTSIATVAILRRILRFEKDNL